MNASQIPAHAIPKRGSLIARYPIKTLKIIVRANISHINIGLESLLMTNSVSRMTINKKDTK